MGNEPDEREKDGYRTADEASLSRRSYLWTTIGTALAASGVSTAGAVTTEKANAAIDAASGATGTDATEAYGFGGRPVPRRTETGFGPTKSLSGISPNRTNRLNRHDRHDRAIPARAVATASDRTWIEAETVANGTDFEPFEVATDETASEGTFIHVPDGTGSNYDGVPDRGHAVYSFDVPADDAYAIWGRVRSESNGNSFYASIGGETYYWEILPVDDEWQWVRLNDGADDPITPSLSVGTRTLEVIWREDGTDLDKLLVTSYRDFVPSGTGGDTVPSQPPYGGTAHELPGRIQAEDFDTGGEGVAYHDRDEENSGDRYRQGGVDIQSAADGSGEYNVGWIEDGEWLEYTVSIPRGTYDIRARIAAIDGGNELRVKLGEETLASVDVPATGDWQEWRTISMENVSVPDGGTRLLRLEIDSDDRYAFNLNWLEFVRSQSPYGGSVPELPGRIEAEEYDQGGEGVAYHDSSTENYGRDYRDDGVDIQETRDVDGGYNVGWMQDGEWLEYSVSVPADSYTIAVRVASPNSGGRIRLALDGEAIGTVSVPNTGGWQNWTTLSIRDVSVAESDLLRLDVIGGDFNVNWIAFSAPDESPDLTYGVQGYGEYGYGGVSTEA